MVLDWICGSVNRAFSSSFKAARIIDVTHHGWTSQLALGMKFSLSQIIDVFHKQQRVPAHSGAAAPAPAQPAGPRHDAQGLRLIALFRELRLHVPQHSQRVADLVHVSCGIQAHKGRDSPDLRLGVAGPCAPLATANATTHASARCRLRAISLLPRTLRGGSSLCLIAALNGPSRRRRCRLVAVRGRRSHSFVNLEIVASCQKRSA